MSVRRPAASLTSRRACAHLSHRPSSSVAESRSTVWGAKASGFPPRPGAYRPLVGEARPSRGRPPTDITCFRISGRLGTMVSHVGPWLGVSASGVVAAPLERSMPLRGAPGGARRGLARGARSDPGPLAERRASSCAEVCGSKSTGGRGVGGGVLAFVSRALVVQLSVFALSCTLLVRLEQNQAPRVGT